MRRSLVLRLRVITLATVLALVGVGIVSLYVLWLSQPTYRGQPLSWWLERRQLARANGIPFEENIASEGIRHIGTNALPVLLGMLRTRDGRLKQVVMGWPAIQPLTKFLFTPADRVRAKAFGGYMALGTTASGQIPALSELLTNDRLPSVRALAAGVFGFIALDDADRAAPALLKATKDKDKDVRNGAFWSLSRIHSRPETTIPILIEGLDDSFDVARENAAAALGYNYGPEAKAAVPALLRTLTINRAASSALLQIDPEAAANAGVK